MYQRNHRVVATGTPLDDRFDKRRARRRRAGYGPVLFGYADQGVDPETVVDRDDPRRSNYEGVLPEFDAVVELDGHRRRRQSWRSQGPTR